MLKCESTETTKITYNIPVITGYEDDCKIIHPETGNIYRDAAEVKSCFRREQNLSFEYTANRCFIIPKSVLHYSLKWISGSIIL